MSHWDGFYVSMRQNRVSVRRLWVGLSLWVGTISDLPRPGQPSGVGGELAGKVRTIRGNPAPAMRRALVPTHWVGEWGGLISGISSRWDKGTFHI